MPICIAGMHRTGTSLVARLLHAAGVDLGPADDLLPPGPGNVEGHFENHRFVEINDAVLAHFGGTWHEPPPQILAADPSLEPLREKARRLSSTFREPWGWKDPRTSLTLSFWRSVCPDLKVVICVRHPLETAESLQTRDEFSLPKGIMLWLDSYRRALADVSSDNRLVTHYDSYFADAVAETTRLSAFSGVGVDPAHVRPNLRHHRRALADLLAGTIHADAIRTYLDLCREAGPVYQTLFLNDLFEIVVHHAAISRDHGSLIEQHATLNEICVLAHRELEETRRQLADRDERLSWRRHRWADSLARFLRRPFDRG